ncbi:MAG: MFS transporter [Pseudomonadota bacterium]
MFYGWWIVIATFVIGVFVGGSTVYGFTAFFEPLINEFGWSYTQVSFVGSLRGVEMGIFSPLVGFLADRFDPRKIVVSGTVLTGLGLLLLSTSQSLSTFYGIYVLVAIGSAGCTSVVLLTAVANWFRKNAGKALGIATCGIGASGFVIPFIVWLIDTYQWRTTFAILGLGIWIVGIPLSFVIRGRPEKYGLFPDGKKTPMNSKRITRGGDCEIGMSFKKAIETRTFWYLNIVEALRMMVLMAVVTHVMPYLSSVGISRTSAGFVAGGIPVLSILGRLGFGWASDLYDKKLVLTFAFCLMGLGVLSFANAHMVWPIIAFAVLFPVGYGGGIAVRAVILREYFGRAIFGKTLGIVMGSAAIGGIVGPLLAGWSFDTLATYRAIWFVFCGVLFVGAVLAFKIKPSFA